MIRRLLLGVGIITIVAVVVLVACFVYVGRETAKYDAESKVYVDAAVIDIGSRWERRALLERAPPELLKVAKPEDVDTLFEAFRRLGPLIEYQGASGGSTVFVSFGADETVSANYVANARFQKGDALFRLALVRKKEQWMINGFRLESPNLMNNLVGHES